MRAFPERLWRKDCHIIRPDSFGQSIHLEKMLKHRFCKGMFCREQSVTGEQVPAEFISNGERITVDSVSGFKMPFEVCRPGAIGRRDWAERFSGMETFHTSSSFLDTAVSLKDEARCGVSGQSPVRMILFHSPQEFSGAPGRMSEAESQYLIFNLNGSPGWGMMWSSGSIDQGFRA